MSNMDNEKIEKLDLEAVRERLASAEGPEYWRGLEEIAETEEFRQWLDDEFPNRSTLLQINRRELLKYMGAGMALAGLSGCRFMPQEKIVPYVKQPEELVPGKPLWFATAFTQGGYAKGVLARSNEGRPTKIEGNPSHPASLGSTDVFMQTSIHDLYDPERSRNVTQNGGPSSWEDFLK